MWTMPDQQIWSCMPAGHAQLCMRADMDNKIYWSGTVHTMAAASPLNSKPKPAAAPAAAESAWGRADRCMLSTLQLLPPGTATWDLGASEPDRQGSASTAACAPATLQEARWSPSALGVPAVYHGGHMPAVHAVASPQPSSPTRRGAATARTAARCPPWQTAGNPRAGTARGPPAWRPMRLPPAPARARRLRGCRRLQPWQSSSRGCAAATPASGVLRPRLAAFGQAGSCTHSRHRGCRPCWGRLTSQTGGASSPACTQAVTSRSDQLMGLSRKAVAAQSSAPAGCQEGWNAPA